MVVFGRPAAMHACRVEDLTSQGACVVVTADLVCDLPDSFELTFDEGRTLRVCRIVWRKRNRIGIAW
jgi:hypothetical protein